MDLGSVVLAAEEAGTRPSRCRRGSFGAARVRRSSRCCCSSSRASTSTAERPSYVAWVRATRRRHGRHLRPDPPRPPGRGLRGRRTSSTSTRSCSCRPASRGRRPTARVTAAEDRYLMTVIATAGDPRFRVSRVDIDRPGPTYTVDTLRDLRAEYAAAGDPVELYFITGADALAQILTWRDHEQVLALAHLVGVTRPGLRALGRRPARGRRDAASRCRRWRSPPPTAGRGSRAGEPWRYLVPDAVVAYATKRGLYSSESVDDEPPPPGAADSRRASPCRRGGGARAAPRRLPRIAGVVVGAVLGRGRAGRAGVWLVQPRRTAARRRRAGGRRPTPAMHQPTMLLQLRGEDQIAVANGAARRRRAGASAGPWC